LNSITDIFGIPELLKIPKCTTFSVKNSKTVLIFFQYLIFIPKFGIFGITTEEYRTNNKNTEKIHKKFRTLLEKQKNLDYFADNVVYLGIFGISGIISVLLNFSIGFFSVFNSIEIFVLKFFGIQ
jgi:hypothetical protein